MTENHLCGKCVGRDCIHNLLMENIVESFKTVTYCVGQNFCHIDKQQPKQRETTSYKQEKFIFGSCCFGPDGRRC